MAESILLDTCTMIWAVEGVWDRLSKTAAKEIERPNSRVSASVISVAELAILSMKSRIKISSPWKTWFRAAAADNGWDVLPVTWEIMEEAYSLPGDFHGDPADRILVATSRVHRMTIVTPDDRIRKYPHVESVW